MIRIHTPLTILVICLSLFSCAHQRDLPRSFQSEENFALNESLMRLHISADESEEFPIVDCYSGQFSKGLEKLRKIPLAKLKADQLNQISSCYMMAKQYKKAEFYFQVAYSTYPLHFGIANNYAILKTEQNEIQLARDLLEHAIALNPAANLPKYNLAIISAFNGQLDQAESLSRGLLSKAPKDELAIQLYALILVLQGKHESSLHYFKKIPIKSWINDDLGLFYCYALIKTGKRNQAIDIWKQTKEASNSQLQAFRLQVERMVMQGT